MHINRKVLPVLAAVGAVALTLAACSGDGGGGGDADAPEGSLVVDGVVIADPETWAQAQEEGTLTIYSAYQAQKDQVIIDNFMEDTGIDVEIVNVPVAQLATRVTSEFTAGTYLPDVIKTAVTSHFDSFNDDGILAKFDSPETEAIPQEFVLGGGTYFAHLQSAMSIAYNTALVDEKDAPKGWEDLLDPKWKGGQIGLADMAAGGTHIATYQFMRNEIDPDFWQKLYDQQPVILAGNAQLTEALTSGEVAVSYAGPANLAEAIGQGAPVKFVADPEGGLPVASNFEAIAAKAPHPAAAQVFINWTLSMAGQSVYASMGEYPVLDGAPAPEIEGVSLPDRDGANIVEPDYEEQKEHSQEWIDEWTETFHFKR